MPLLQRILAFCREEGISESTFGRRIHDHGIVDDIRHGRMLGIAKLERIEQELKYGKRQR